MGWARFLRAVTETEGVAASEHVDMRAELVRRWSALRQFAPTLLRTFSFEGARSATGLLKAVALLRDANASGTARRRLPTDMPTGSSGRAGGRS